MLFGLPLPVFWFWVIAAIFTFYFFLEGFDFGVDLLRPLLAKSEAEERAMVGTIGPFWDGNEVWVILAAGVIFATFPRWYGALLTGMYPAFILILLSLLGRGVSFEFRNQVEHRHWRRFWDFTSFAGSLLPAYLWGMIMANLVRGLPIGTGGEYRGTVWDFVNLFSVLGGFVTVLLFMLHGATFLQLRLHTGSALYLRARRAALFWGALASAAVLGFVYLGYVREELFRDFGLVPWLFPAAAAVTLASIWFSLSTRRDGAAFVMSGLTIVFSTLTIFIGMFPSVLPSTLGRAYNLTISNAASGPLTLHLMSVVGLIFLPLIIGYQVWNYYDFLQRVQVDEDQQPEVARRV